MTGIKAQGRPKCGAPSASRQLLMNSSPKISVFWWKGNKDIVPGFKNLKKSLNPNVTCFTSKKEGEWRDECKVNFRILLNHLEFRLRRSRGRAPFATWRLARASWEGASVGRLGVCAVNAAGSRLVNRVDKFSSHRQCDSRCEWGSPFRVPPPVLCLISHFPFE